MKILKEILIFIFFLAIVTFIWCLYAMDQYAL